MKNISSASQDRRRTNKLTLYQFSYDQPKSAFQSKYLISVIILHPPVHQQLKSLLKILLKLRLNGVFPTTKI